MITKNRRRRILNYKIRKIKRKHKFNLDGTTTDFTRKDAIALYQGKTIEKLNS